MLESSYYKRQDNGSLCFDTNHFFKQHCMQHGFHPMMSCITQLLRAMEHWTKSLDDGNDVDIVYLDFARHLTVFHTSAYCLS